MSCITRIEVIILDLDSFKKACQELDLEYVEGQREYRTDDGQRKCEHAVRMTNGQACGHEIGLVRSRYDDRRKQIVADENGDGWAMMLDTYGTGSRKIMERVGTKCETLLHKYGCHAVRAKATQMNWSLTEQQNEDGSVVFSASPRAMLQEQESGSW